MARAKLVSANLDDQSYNDIVSKARRRIPYLCPAWTDFNPHDPGITLLELMAWYKEMQQYHMNRIPDATKRKFLKLLGIIPKPEQASSCRIAIPYGSGYFPAGSSFVTEQDVRFELDSDVDSNAVRLDKIYIDNGKMTDITPLIREKEITVHPFGRDGTYSRLILAFGVLSHPGVLKIHFDVTDDYPVKRCSFDGSDYQPRELIYSIGEKKLTVLLDETHSLSQSGDISLMLPEELTTRVLGDGEYYCLEISEIYAGCEESVCLENVCCELHSASQVKTLAASVKLTAVRRDDDRFEVCLSDELSRDGELLLFAAEGDSFRAIEVDEYYLDDMGRHAVFSENATELLAVSLDAVESRNLIFDSTGAPSMELEINTGNTRLLCDSAQLLCDTLYEDGSVRPALWSRVDDLLSAGRRERVFVCENLGEGHALLRFGNGENGEIVPAGKNAVIVVSMKLSLCESGNIQSSCGLYRAERRYDNTSAMGGSRPESIEDAVARFRISCENAPKCATIADLRRICLTTPGLRVAAVKVIPGYEANAPINSAPNAVTIVVIPYSDREKLPMPDENFIKQIKNRLEHFRTICTKIDVIAPLYTGIRLSIQVKSHASDIREKIKKVLEGYFDPKSATERIGESVRRDDIAALLYRQEGIEAVGNISISSLGVWTYSTANGDLVLSRHAIAYLKQLDLYLL